MKKRWQDYTEEQYKRSSCKVISLQLIKNKKFKKKDLHDPDNHSGVITT